MFVYIWLCFLKHALYSGQMVCGALWRTVLWLRQRLLGGEVGFLGTFQRMQALDSAPCDVETWPGKRADWLKRTRAN
jgi:hypothetical protein